MDEIQAVGSACGAWVWDALYRACSVPDQARPPRLAEAARRFAQVGPVLEQYGRWQERHQSLASTSTAPHQLRRALQEIGAPSDSTGADTATTPRAPTRADELRPLLDRELHVELLSIRRSALYRDHIVLLVRDAEQAWTLHVWQPGPLDGVWCLDRARVSVDESTVRFESPNGALILRGTPILEEGSDAEPSAPRVDAPEPERTESWPQAHALLERLNRRARWDYEIVGDRRRGRLALEGRSGMYEEGCHIVLRDVHAARLPRTLSHAVFRWLPRDEVPATLRPPATGWLALGIEADARAFEAETLVVVARGILYADDDGPTQTFRVESGSPSRGS